MKALGEEGLDVLVEEIKKRSSGGDGSDGKNGSVVDELDEILRTIWRLYQEKYYDNLNGTLKNENLSSNIVAIVNKFCKNIASIYNAQYYNAISVLPTNDIIQSIDTILKWVHEKLLNEHKFSIMATSVAGFSFTLFDL